MSISEEERLKGILIDIADLTQTSPYLYQEPVNPYLVIDKIYDLAVEGYRPK